MNQSLGKMGRLPVYAIEAKGESEESLQKRFFGFSWVDIGLLAAAAVGLVPLYVRSGLPFRIDIGGMASAFWLATAAEAICIAVMLYVIALPLSETVRPFLKRLRANRVLLVMGILIGMCLSLMMGPGLGIMLTVDALAVAELMHRRGARFEKSLGDALFPAGYLFCVILLLYAYNHAIAGIRYAGTFDGVFAKLDTQALGIQTSTIAHWGQTHLPGWAFAMLQTSYFGMYGRVGATLILAALLSGRREAVKMVRALLISYAIAVALFALIPVKGPYLTCTVPENGHAQSLPVYRTQQALVDKMQDLYAHRTTGESGTIDLLDYYIGFPSMHAALPLIAMWFIRRWRRVLAVLLAAYTLLLLPSTVLLEWHYGVDLLGGMAVAALSVTLSESVDLLLARRAAAAKPLEAVSCEA
ncbi:MAG TPA: phosphatase PAP2 family protein [Terracidiphilus sp.]|nr:phosphatase PAP2 family protein [Terracidiphilus sp.]